MTTTDDCLFCKIVRGDIKAAETYRDDRSVAFKDIGPKAPLHELVIPVKHIASLAEASPADGELFGHLMVVASQRARESGLAGNGFRNRPLRLRSRPCLPHPAAAGPPWPSRSPRAMKRPRRSCPTSPRPRRGVGSGS